MFNDYFAHAQFVNHTLCSILKKMAEAVNDTETVVDGKDGRKRKYRSPIWNYFDKVEALCILCKVKYQHSNNTSNLSKVTVTKMGIVTINFDSIYRQSTCQNGLYVRKSKRLQNVRSKGGNHW